MITAAKTFESYQADDDVTVIQFTVAEIDFINHDLVATELRDLVETDCPSKLLLDMKRIHHLSRPGLSLLVVLLRNVSRDGGRLRLCSLLPQVQQAFGRLSLDRVFAIYEDLPQALQDF
jgi:anti-anti-sigma factor